MDGTLLGRDSQVSARSAGIISDLSARGAMITVATARTAATVDPLLSSTVTNVPAIVMTGAARWLRDRREYDNVSFIPEKDLCEIFEVCGKYDIHPFVYALETRSFQRVFHDGERLSLQEENFVAERRNLPLKHFELNCRADANSAIMLCYAMGYHERLFAAAAELRRRGDLAVSCYYDIFNHEIAHLEIFAPGVSKAAAVSALKQSTGAERLVVFGDNLNDIPMLEVADYAVAVENAFDEVKQVADRVIGPNTADSVAEFIKTDFNN